MDLSYWALYSLPQVDRFRVSERLISSHRHWTLCLGPNRSGASAESIPLCVTCDWQELRRGSDATSSLAPLSVAPGVENELLSTHSLLWPPSGSSVTAELQLEFSLD